MEIHKKLLALAFSASCAALCLSSCSSGNSEESGEETQYVDAEYIDSLNKTIDVYASATQEQRETLFRIMKELDEIADNAFALGKERQLKGKVTDMKMVDKIKFRLATIKTELDQASEKAMENPELCNTIEKLKQQIDEQNYYISHLRSSINVKKGKLQNRLTDLEDVNQRLENTKSEYEVTNARLNDEYQKLDVTIRNSWVMAGDKLVASADEVKLTSNHGKLVGKTREAKKRILRKAVDCYKKASELGDPTARQKISLAETKIQNLN